MKLGAYFLNSPFSMLRRALIRFLSLCVATRRGRVIHLLSVPWLLLLTWLTSVAWFLTDDAFISFRYVRNLLEGHGLVFNPGEYVEGYTNFLWILELAALWELFGLRPEHTANWLSVAYTGGTLVALWWWLARAPTRLSDELPPGRGRPADRPGAFPGVHRRGWRSPGCVGRRWLREQCRGAAAGRRQRNRGLAGAA